nr:MAG TPA: hypothetical protein [Caudoviricetes sp.]
MVKRHSAWIRLDLIGKQNRLINNAVVIRKQLRQVGVHMEVVVVKRDSASAHKHRLEVNRAITHRENNFLDATKILCATRRFAIHHRDIVPLKTKLANSIAQSRIVMSDAMMDEVSRMVASKLDTKHRNHAVKLAVLNKALLNKLHQRILRWFRYNHFISPLHWSSFCCADSDLSTGSS